jgi:type IV secretory pathway VirB6-like protein
MAFIPIVFILAGLVISTVVSAYVYRTVHVKTKWIRHSATVTGLDDDTDGTCSLRYRYEYGGKRHDGVSSSCSSANRRYRIGDPVPIVIDPSDAATSDKYEEIFGYLHIILFALGLLFVAMGIVGLIGGPDGYRLF